MEDYELDPDKIINWATDYASYEDLEHVAKSLYGIYAIWRKRDYPKEHRTAKQHRRELRQQGKHSQLGQL